MPTPIRFKGIVGTTAQIATDRFAGRIAFDSTLNRFVMFYDATNYATMARRDVLETFAAGINDSTLTAGRVMYAGTSGRHQSDAGLLYTTSGGQILTVGDGTSSAARIGVNGAAGQTKGYRLQTTGITRGFLALDATDQTTIQSLDGAGSLIDIPVTIPNTAAAAIAFTRTLNTTGNIQTSGVTRISSGGAATLTTLSTTGLATLQSVNITGLTASRMLSLDASKNVQSLDAAGSRSLIGAYGSGDNAAFGTLSTSGLATLAQATVSDIAADRIVTTTTAGRLTGDAGLTRTALSGVTRLLFVGDNAVAGNAAFIARRTSGFFSGFLYQDSGSATRWSHTYDNSFDWILSAYTSGAALIDNPLSIVNTSAGLITIGGSTLRPVNFTGAIQTSGVQRISGAGAASFTTLSTTGLATLAQATVSDLTTGRMVSTTTGGRLQALDAAASRALIGAASSAGSVAYATLFTGRRTVSCTNGAMATLIPSYTVAANGWTVGMRLVFEVNFFTARDGQFEVKLGGNLIASYGLGTVTRSIFRIELVCLSTGATARFAYAASVYDPSTSTATTQTIIGDSQANVDGVGDNWSVDTTASTSIAFEYTATAGASPGNVVIHSGSVQISTP